MSRENFENTVDSVLKEAAVEEVVPGAAPKVLPTIPGAGSAPPEAQVPMLMLPIINDAEVQALDQILKAAMSTGMLELALPIGVFTNRLVGLLTDLQKAKEAEKK